MERVRRLPPAAPIAEATLQLPPLAFFCVRTGIREEEESSSLLTVLLIPCLEELRGGGSGSPSVSEIAELRFARLLGVDLDLILEGRDDSSSGFDEAEGTGRLDATLPLDEEMRLVEDDELESFEEEVESLLCFDTKVGVGVLMPPAPVLA